MIRWDLLQPIDYGANVLAGYQIGEGLVKKQRLQGALSAYAQDPTNPGVQNALAQASLEFAWKLGSQRAQSAAEAAERQRIGQIVSNPDLGAARQQALQGGDLDLAKQLGEMDEGQRKRAYD